MVQPKRFNSYWYPKTTFNYLVRGTGGDQLPPMEEVWSLEQVSTKREKQKRKEIKK